MEIIEQLIAGSLLYKFVAQQGDVVIVILFCGWLKVSTPVLTESTKKDSVEVGQLSLGISSSNYVFGMCLLQGELNDTIVLQLLDDATPEDKYEYKVSLSNIQTFGNDLLLVSLWLSMKSSEEIKNSSK